MRHINRCASEWNLHLQLGSRAGPWVSILCRLQDNIHIYWLHPPKKSTTKEQEILQKIKLPANGIVLPSPTYTETIERTGQKTSCIVQPGHTNENPALRGVDLKPILKDEPIEAKAYWTFTDCLEACLWKSISTESHTNQP